MATDSTTPSGLFGAWWNQWRAGARRVTVGEWWAIYDATYTAAKRSARRDRQMMAHALPVFGELPIAEVRKSDCVRYLLLRRAAQTANPGWKRQRPVAEGTIQRERSFLQAVFQQAVEDGHLERNPWRSIPRKAYAVRDRVLEPDEQERLLAVLSPRFQRFVLFLLGTGLRLEEARGIAPDRDLRWEHRVIHVRGKFGKERDVPIFSEVEPILRTQLEADGGLWTQNQQRLREVLGEAAKKASIPHVSPHTLRHTFGARWVSAGYDIFQLSKILGHASVAMTERVYAHLRRRELVKVTAHVRLGLTAPSCEKRTAVIPGPWRGPGKT